MEIGSTKHYLILNLLFLQILKIIEMTEMMVNATTKDRKQNKYASWKMHL